MEDSMDSQIYLMELAYEGCPHGDGKKKLQCNGGVGENDDGYKELRDITDPDGKVEIIIPMIWEIQKEAMEKICFVCQSCSGNPSRRCPRKLKNKNLVPVRK